MSNRKEYTLPNGRKAAFEYDVCGIGKITLECMDELIGMIADRPRGEWIDSTELTWTPSIKCSNCGAMFHEVAKDFIAKYGLSVANDWNFCPNCGADMRGESNE